MSRANVTCSYSCRDEDTNTAQLLTHQIGYWMARRLGCRVTFPLVFVNECTFYRRHVFLGNQGWCEAPGSSGFDCDIKKPSSKWVDQRKLGSRPAWDSLLPRLLVLWSHRPLLCLSVPYQTWERRQRGIASTLRDYPVIRPIPTDTDSMRPLLLHGWSLAQPR